MDKSFAEHFSAEWIESWNARDLKAAVGAYWKKALELVPDLKFELLSVLMGVNSITLYYKGARGRLAAEVFHFGPDQKVTRAFAHYAV